MLPPGAAEAQLGSIHQDHHERSVEPRLHLLHAIQIDLLREWRGLCADGKTKQAEALVPSLLLSVNAIASGERTTG